MSEVKHYHVSDTGLAEGASLGRITVVLVADFDNVVRLFLDAAERCVAAERREQALQQRLNAADQRIDELVSELEKVRLGPCKMIVGDELP